MLRRMLAVLALTAAVGCGGSDSPTGPAAIVVVGSYTLKSVNGQALPATLSQTGGTKIEVTDDLYTLNADHTYSEVGHFRVTTATTVTSSAQADLGAYSATNGAVSLTSSVGNPVSSGTINGNTFTVVSGGFTGVYSRN